LDAAVPPPGHLTSAGDYSVLVPVGPGELEIERMHDTLESVRAFESSDEIHLILVDDNPVPRDLARHAGDWASLDLVRTPLWEEGAPDPYSAMTAGTIEGMRVAARERPKFLLKLDTDALVVGPTADRLRRVFADDLVGMAGSYTHTCTGNRRDWRGWERPIRLAAHSVARGPGRAIRVRSPRHARAVRRSLALARANGYEVGAHCLGGAYAVGARLLEREELLDWRPWVGTDISEDVVVGLLTFAAGLHVRGYVEPGRVFALGWRELPLPPEQILARGYGVVHSVRDQPYGGERELRKYFRDRRAAHSQKSSAAGDIGGTGV
jgi:hypothetical protein